MLLFELMCNERSSMDFSKYDISKRMLAILLIISIAAWLMPASAEKTYAASNVAAPKTNGSVSCWDCVYFGAYPQSDAGGNKRDPIKWRVLSVNGDDAFIISDTKLDLERYYTSKKSVAFANSYLKKWLNGTFLNKAFTSSEQNSIKNMHYGKVAVMSVSEAQSSSYGFVSDRARVAVTTNYTQQKIKKNNPAIANSVNSVYGAYWLSDTSDSKGYIKTVRGNTGKIDSAFQVDNTIICVRPVLHLNLSSSVWSHAGKVMSNGQTAPSTPAGVTAQKTAYNKIKISWNKVFEADGYEIYLYKNSNYVSSKIISGAGTTSCAWTGLTPGSGYQCKVRSFWNVGSSKKYGSFSSTISVELPKASQTITSKYSSKLSKYCSKSTFNLGAAAKTPLTYKSNNTSIASVDTKGNVKVKRPGTVKITITAKGTKSYYSQTRTITIIGKLKAPVAKARTGSKKGQIKLSWGSVYGAEGYIVSRYDKKRGYVNKWRVNKTSTVNKYKTQYRKYNSKTGKYYWSNVKTTTGLPIIVENGLTKGKRYYYKVKAYRGNKSATSSKTSAAAKK